MPRLIDADALKESIVANVYPVRDFFNSNDYGMFWTGGIEKAIDEQPTIDPQLKWERDTAVEQLRQLGYGLGDKVKRGRWVKAEKGGEWWYACSICSSHIPKTLFGQDWHSSYCPNCGARMVEGEEG